MEEVNIEIGGYKAIIKEGKVTIYSNKAKTIEIPKDQIFMLSKILEKMEWTVLEY